MTRIHRSMTGSGAAAKNYANRHTYSRLMLNERLSFVYDLVHPNKRSFESLNFVLNAGQKPLLGHTGDDEFLRTYGLPKKLEIKAASARQVLGHDWWSELYV